MSSMIVAPNVARNEEIRRDIKKNLVPLVRKVRDDRRQYKETWLRYHRIWSRERDQQAYRGRSRVYIPFGRKLVENWTKRLKRDLFPTDDWFQVRALREAFEQKVPAVKALLQYFFTKHIHLRRQATPWLRQLVMYGTSPVAVGWRKDVDATPVLRQLLDDEGRLTDRWETKLEEAVRYLGPTFQPVDLFSWHIWPVTCQDVEDADLIFQDILMGREKIERYGKTPIHEAAPDLGTVFDPQAVDELLERYRVPVDVSADKFEAERRRIADKGFNHPLDQQFPLDLRPVDLTRIMWRRRWEDGEDRGYLITLGADEVILGVQQNPYWTGVPPWLCGKFVEVQNEFYGRGLPEVFDYLQYDLNDTADQANDALVWSTNPIAMVDVGLVQDPESLLMRPAAKWLVAKGGVEFTNPPTEPAQIGMAAVATKMGLMSQLADVTPLGAPQAGKSRGRAQQNSAGMQLMLQEAQVDVREVTELIEDLVMNRFLRMAWVLTTQCLDRPQALRITGADGVSIEDKVVTLEDVTGDYEFDWLGSVATQNAQVRGAQMLQGIGVLAKLPADQLQAQGVSIDWAYAAREFWKIGLGLPGAERLVKTAKRQKSVDWRLENELFRVGRGDEVVVMEGDDDDDHLQGHQHAMMDPALPGPVRMQVERHQRAHLAGKLAKEFLKKQQAMQQQAQQVGMASAAGAPPAARMAQAGGARPQAPMGPGRMASTTSVDDLYRQMPRGVM